MPPNNGTNITPYICSIAEKFLPAIKKCRRKKKFFIPAENEGEAKTKYKSGY
jgi:hypothetical protein